MFLSAGKNIVDSIWRGIKSAAHRPIEAIKGIVSRVRDYLPFSPAKAGELRDIHRIRLVETIAQSIKAAPLIKAGGHSAGPATIHFAPVIHLSGGATAKDANMLTAEMKRQFERLMKDYEGRMRRVKH